MINPRDGSVSEEDLHRVSTFADEVRRNRERWEGKCHEISRDKLELTDVAQSRLKALVDTAEVEWEQYELTAIYGGEGITETMRDYLGRVFRRVYGSYGASDLEINLAAENDFTIALRRLLADRADLLELVGRPDHGVLPLVLQYNPIDYYVESLETGELVITLCRRENAAPKVRYNIRDLGHVVRLRELRRALTRCGLSMDDLPGRPDLPLWAGRRRRPLLRLQDHARERRGSGLLVA